jgi:hypothetical protein
MLADVALQEICSIRSHQERAAKPEIDGGGRLNRHLNADQTPGSYEARVPYSPDSSTIRGWPYDRLGLTAHAKRFNYEAATAP